MSRSLLSPSDYIDAPIFRAEQERIFRTLWIFAGVRQLLSEPDAFVTRSIGGIPVVIQNFGGELRAFKNQCAHRQMPLQFDDYGQRRLACRYHGWIYSENGSVKLIPDEETLYRYPESERTGLCLTRYAVQTIGNLVFVCLAPNPAPIEHQFRPELIAEIESMSAQFSDDTAFARIPAAYNWKLNFENVLDSNHVAYVHPRSFQPLLKNTDAAASAAPAARAGRASLSDLSFSAHAPYQLKPQPWHKLVERQAASDTYCNFFLYPNVNFISLAGYVFLIQQFDPVAADRTDVLFTLTTARAKKRIAAMPAILWGHLKGEKRVLDEDICLLERLQGSLHEDGAHSQHGAYESRLVDVASVYAQLMGRST